MITVTSPRINSSLALVLVALLAMGSASYAQQVKYEPVHAIEEPVSFRTEDGWTIHGTLTRPAQLGAGKRIAAALLLHSSSHDQDLFSQQSYPGFSRMQNYLVTLRMDIRGRGKSEGPLELHSFTPQQRDSLYLDVKSALDFLAGQKWVDARRIGILAEEISADSAIRGAAGDPRVKAAVLVSGRLSAAAKEVIETSPQLALLCLVSSEDRDSFRDMTDAYKLSKNSNSDIFVYSNLGHGAAMFSTWRYNYPSEEPLDDMVVNWLIERLNALGSLQEVSFKTEDGWIITADLISPAGKGRAPAIVLLHSSITDRHMYYALARTLVESGFVVLNIDFRGRGKSRNKGNWLELRLTAPEEVDRGYLDVKAAIDYLISQDNVDPARIGVVGTVIGARYALLAAAKDPRISAAVSVIGYVPPEAEEKELAAMKTPVLYIVSRDLGPVARAMTALYQKTKENGSKLMALSGGAYGYGIFTLNRKLDLAIAGWLKRQLDRNAPAAAEKLNDRR